MKLNLMNKQKIDSYFMNLSCEEINYLYETYFNKPKEAINYTRCCVGEAEQLQAYVEWKETTDIDLGAYTEKEQLGLYFDSL